MSLSDKDVTEVLNALSGGQEIERSQLLALVYEELRKLAHAKMARERPGTTLQPTALVHEAYLRLVRDQAENDDVRWENRRHFFGAAATAMRRILVERARKRNALRRGGDKAHMPLRDEDAATESPSLDYIALDEALAEFEQKDKRACEVVHLRYFAGLSIEETAQTLGIATRTVKKDWTAARAWLHQRLSAEDTTSREHGRSESDG